MKADPYASHIAALASVVATFPGRVLEVGAGEYSTPLLHALCGGRELVTVEADPRWLAPYQSLACERHRFAALTDELLAEPWGVVFVDNAPAYMRGRIIGQLTHAGVVMMHDAERSHYGLDAVRGRFEHSLIYDRVKPWTIALSRSPLTALRAAHPKLWH